MSYSSRLMVRGILAMLFLVGMSQVVFADGTETLGPPSVAISTGSGAAAAGVGLALGQPDVINLNVPVTATVKQTLLYWEGQSQNSPSGDSTLTVNGTEVTGTLIGGPTLFYLSGGSIPTYTSTYRADITGLGVIGPGSNAITIGGLDFGFANNGAGLIVIYDDGTDSRIFLRDGNDAAYKFFTSPLDATVTQTFTFGAATVARVAPLAMFFSSVQGEFSTGSTIRPNRISVTVGGVTTDYDDVLNSNNGQEWDTYTVDVNIPAGATSVIVQAISGPGGDEDPNTPDPRPASLVWSAAALSVPCLGEIGDFVWKDCDGNGIQDPGEAGIPGITILLKDSGGSVIATQVTDVNGNYLFSRLCAGEYVVEVDSSTVPTGLVPTTCNNTAGIASNSNCSPSPVTLATDNSTDLSIDFGYKGTGVIGDVVWKDANCDGVQDPDENGIPDVRVWLKQNNITIQTSMTDASGQYQFTNVCGGTYIVEVDSSTLPADCKVPSSCANTPDVADNSNCSPSPVTITNDQTDLTIDFGYCTTRICLIPDNDCIEQAFLDVVVQPNGDVLVTFDLGTGINDNSYGTNTVQWPRDHKFSNLTGSDKAQFIFKNGAGTKVLDFIVDYLSAKSGTPSGYASLGVTGGDGKIKTGSAAHVLMATTSLDKNLNTLGLCVSGDCNAGGVNLLVNSPPVSPANTYNVANPIFSGWDFSVRYTVKVAAAAFGPSGFGSVNMGKVHNSPPKCGDKAVTFRPCDELAPFCEDAKPKALTMIYTGSDCSATSHSQDDGKVTCTDHAPLQTNAKILVGNKSNPNDSKFKKWFEGVVGVGDTFKISATNAGESKIGKETHWFIYNASGTQLLQSGEFHTSCSQTLQFGDQFGALNLIGFTPEGAPKLVQDGAELSPESFRLYQNYPNPFNPETEVFFQMGESGHATLTIFNTLGQVVRTLADGYFEAGVHGITWNATDNSGNPVSSGIYFYKLTTGEYTSLKKMSLLK